MSDEAKALKLWRQWFEWSGVPWELDRDDIDHWCFFCGERKDEGHTKDCVYVQAAVLLGIKFHGTVIVDTPLDAKPIEYKELPEAQSAAEWHKRLLIGHQEVLEGEGPMSFRKFGRGGKEL